MCCNLHAIMETVTDKSTSAEATPTLQRTLGLLSVIAVVIGSTIGSGIFRSPAGIAANVPNKGLYLLLWAVGGAFTLCGALTYAELASAFPQTGGVYVYLREGFGKLPAFLFGWSQLVIIRSASMGALAIVVAEYLLRLLGKPITVEVNGALLTAPNVRYIAVATVIIAMILNLVGVKLGAIVQNLTTGAKYGALVLLVLLVFVLGAQNPVPPTLEAVPVNDNITLALIGSAFISILWVYDGWADVTYVSGEVKRPERNLPLALIIGTLAVLAIYLLANLAYFHLFDVTQIAGSRLVAADAAYMAIGQIGVVLISIAVMISAFGTLNASVMTGPRTIFAMADDGLFFKALAAVHSRFKTPYISIILVSVLAVFLVLFVGSFQKLSDMFVLAIWPFYVLGVAAVFTLRRKMPDLPRPYRTLGYPVTPALFILAVMFLLGNAFIDDVKYFTSLSSTDTAGKSFGEIILGAPQGAVLVSVLILLGIPVYYIWQAMNKESKQ
jgi:basic amino acid/polyamine antiporter, APA family